MFSVSIVYHTMNFSFFSQQDIDFVFMSGVVLQKKLTKLFLSPLLKGEATPRPGLTWKCL